jgi:hypothetical protein
LRPDSVQTNGSENNPQKKSEWFHHKNPFVGAPSGATQDF